MEVLFRLTGQHGLQFRDCQRDVLEHIIYGARSTFYLGPCGAGKSLVLWVLAAWTWRIVVVITHTNALAASHCSTVTTVLGGKSCPSKLDASDLHQVLASNLHQVLASNLHQVLGRHGAGGVHPRYPPRPSPLTRRDHRPYPLGRRGEPRGANWAAVPPHVDFCGRLRAQ